MNIIGGKIMLPDGTQEAIAFNSLISNTYLITIDAQDDVNPLDVNFQPFSFYHILSGIMFILCFLSIFQSIDAYLKYLKFLENYFVFNYTTISTATCALGNIVRSLYFLTRIIPESNVFFFVLP